MLPSRLVWPASNRERDVNFPTCVSMEPPSLVLLFNDKIPRLGRLYRLTGIVPTRLLPCRSSISDILVDKNVRDEEFYSCQVNM